MVVVKVEVGKLPVFPAGASAVTDGRWWRCVIGICVARREGNTQLSFPLSSLSTQTLKRTRILWHTLQLVIAFPTNCPQERTFYRGRQLHRLRVNMCFTEALCRLLPGVHTHARFIGREERSEWAQNPANYIVGWRGCCHGHCHFTHPMLFSPCLT